MKQAIRIVFYSPKGGSGKSTGLAQVAGYFARKGKSLLNGSSPEAPEQGCKVLIVDADPSYNATQSFYVPEDKPKFCYTHLMYQSKRTGRPVSREMILDTIVPAFSEEMLKKGSPQIREARKNIFIAPSRKNILDRKMIDLDDQLVCDKDYTFFDAFFKPIYGDFDIILIDAPGQITGSSYLNAICMSHFVVSPSETDIYSTNALLEVQEIVKRARAISSHPINFLGFYFSRIDRRRGSDKDAEKDYAQEKVYMKTAIRNLAIIPKLQGEKELLAFTNVEDNMIKEAMKNDEDVGTFDKLTCEIVERLKLEAKKEMLRKRKALEEASRKE